MTINKKNKIEKGHKSVIISPLQSINLPTCNQDMLNGTGSWKEKKKKKKKKEGGKPSQIDLVFTIEQINHVLALTSTEETMGCPLHLDSIE